MHTNRGTNVPRTSLPCPPRYGNSTRRRFAKALGANHLLVYYRSGGGSTGLRQVRPPLLSHTILTRETGTKIHMYSEDYADFGSGPPPSQSACAPPDLHGSPVPSESFWSPFSEQATLAQFAPPGKSHVPNESVVGDVTVPGNTVRL